MSDVLLEKKYVKELEGKQFVIPAYQRGYRWTAAEVDALLNDLKSCEGEYCLQPVVVKNTDKQSTKWEVVDGQQRLTTIFLLLSYLQKDEKKPFYSLTYETRKESKEFLERIAERKVVDQENGKDNIDYHHICEVYIAIGGCLEESEKEAILQKILNAVYVVWYTLPDEEQGSESFTRLNGGKIPLEDSELVRALFLKSHDKETTQDIRNRDRIAREWDDIERTLHSESFWAFIQDGKESFVNRIEYLLRVAHPEVKRSELIPHPIYNTFEKLFRDGATPISEWKAIRKQFSQMEEWHEDNKCYHFIGFLIDQGKSLSEIRKWQNSDNETKTGFRSKLRAEVFKTVFGKELQSGTDVDQAVSDYLKKLSYGDDSIRKILLLFNIVTIMQSKDRNYRFPFDLYRNQEWDIEHVHACADDMPKVKVDQLEWLKTVRKYYGSAGTRKKESNNKPFDEIGEMCESTAWQDDEFKRVFNQLVEEYGSGSTNNINNLVLLDRDTNRSYKAHIFPVKRWRILNLDHEDKYCMPCTRNVFMKCYSKRVDRMLQWDGDDGTDYLEAMIASFVDLFLKGGNR